MFKCVKITSFFFVLLFELLPDTTSTVSGDCDFLRSCVNYKYREKKKIKHISYISALQNTPGLFAVTSSTHVAFVGFLKHIVFSSCFLENMIRKTFPRELQ